MHEAAPVAAAAAAPSGQAPVDASDNSAVWQRTLEVLSRRGHGLTSLLADAKFDGIWDARAVIRFHREHATFLRMLERNGKKDQLRDAICEAVGQRVGLRLELDAAVEAVLGEAPGASPPRIEVAPVSAPTAAEAVVAVIAPRTPVTAELRQSLRDSQPLVRRLIDELGAEIVKVE
jgi:hypothetical protein